MTILKYKGYTLEMTERGYVSVVNRELIKFDTASQWKQYIDYITK